MDGALGRASWRWLFIIEGSITAFVALMAIVVLPDYPATTKRLSLRERAMAVYRLELDVGEKDEDTLSLLQALKAALLDYRLYLLALIIVTKTTASAITQFVPTVVATFGFNKVLTLVMTAPPYLFATVVSLIISRLSDRKPERCVHLTVPLAVAMAGFIIAATTTKTAPRYLSLFLLLGGLYGSFNIALAWVSSTFPRPRAKRASAYALINGMGNLAQVWSPYLYPSSDGPLYTTAFVTNSVMTAASILFAVILRWCLARNNAQMDMDEATATAGMAEKDLGTFKKKPRYVL